MERPTKSFETIAHDATSKEMESIIGNRIWMNLQRFFYYYAPTNAMEKSSPKFLAPQIRVGGIPMPNKV